MSDQEDLPRMARLAAGGLPSRCRICHDWPSATLCADCIARFPGAARRCRRCAMALPRAAGADAVCMDCQRADPPLDQVLACRDYAYPWSFLLARYKFGEDIGLGRVLGRLMAATPGLAPLLAQADWIVPLPLSPRRQRERGFNQAEGLARAMIAGQPRATRRRLRPDLLERPGHTLPQHELPREQRLMSVRHAYRVPEAARAPLAARQVLLVDDVMTTGASLQAAALALRAAGACAVSAVVLARA